jgi:UDPglucose 6-dehydrogenase
VSDFLLPQRVVVGIAGGGSTHAQPASIDQRIAGDEQASALVATILRLYEPLGAPTLVTDLTSAEMIKVASNVFLAAKITFANELARLSVATGADAQAVVEGLGLDGRIGRAFLSPGPGYGGSCLPSQARALPDLARRAGVRARLMDAIAPSNDDQVTWLLDRAEAAHGGSLAGARVALLGLTFKAGTDDLRESPSLRLAVELVRRGAAVVAHDPLATAAGVARLARVERIAVEGADDVAAACSGADVVIVATEWPAFRSLDWRRIARSMRGRVIADARSIVDAVAATRAGLRLVGLPAMPVPGPAMTRAMATAATMNVPAARRLSADRAPATGVTGKAAGPASDQARSRRPAAVGAPAAVAALVP